MRKILFITSRNIISTSGEIRLIKNRANSLFVDYGIETEFLVCRKSTDSKQEIINEAFKIHSFLYKKFRFFAVLKKWKKLFNKAKELIKLNNYNAIIISGYVPSRIVLRLRKCFPNLCFVGDVHGAFDELKEFKTKSFLKNLYRKLMFCLFMHNAKKWYKYMNSFFVVSNALKDYLIDTFKINKASFFVVPCANSSFLIDASQQKKYRTKYRAKYGIKEDEIVFVYSGGVSPWQCIGESVDLFKSLRAKISTSSKMLIFSSNIKEIERYRSEDVVIDSLDSKEVDCSLCAGDIAFLLRGDFVTNHVSFPNKFLEYVKSGMFIIATPFIFDVSEIVRDNSIGAIYINDVEEILKLINDRVPYGGDFDTREKILQYFAFKERLKDFVSFLEQYE